MCRYGGHMYTCTPNMKVLCLNLWLGEVCTDEDKDNNAQRMIVQGSLVDKPNEPNIIAGIDVARLFAFIMGLHVA